MGQRLIRFRRDVKNPCGQLDNDVFRHPDDFEVPEHCFVAGAGPGLQKQLAAIGPGQFVVACNSAIQADYDFSLWFVYDPNALRMDWFEAGISKGRKGSYIFGQELHRRDRPGDYSYNHRPIMRGGKVLAPGALMGGATVTCCAAQFLYWWGCNSIGLAGVPLTGRVHYDGSRASRHLGPWGPHPAYFTACATKMQEKGVYVYSLGETAIRVPVHASPPHYS